METNNNNRGMNFFKCLLPVVIVFCVQTALSFIAMQFLICLQASNFQGSTYVDFMEQCMNAFMDTDFSVGISLLYAVVCAVLFGFWYAREFVPKIDGKRVSLMKSITQYPPIMIVGAILFTVGLQYVCVYVMNALAMVFPSWLAFYQQLVEGMGMTEDSYSVLLILYSVIVGPICEELTFRGLTLGYARRAMPFWAANIVQAMLFAGMHMNMLQGVYTFAIGLLLGYIFYKSGNILLTMILHVLFNFVGMFLGNYIVVGSTAIAFFAILLVGMIVTYVGLEIILKALQKKVNKTVSSSDMNSTM